ncbi:ATP-binding protein [Inmirania thermothiophila]|uniref:Uncharacterized protein n=1 Tax=Inmirania thermothiophila TaxID=1750597 RepID=A0A3N1Y1T0_9GAMM|nr:ATP-binding protein [Inmirania thermothiophila]ROR32793.1 hypothetical protein EDC57_2005 [Inmirania thermothiophila]
MTPIEDLVGRIERLLERLEPWIPPPPAPPPEEAVALRWRRRGPAAWLEPVPHPRLTRLEDLLGIDRQKAEVVRNTAQFVAGLPANNVLLTGARGTGKSSLVKALLPAFAGEGLRLVELDAQDLEDLPEVVERLAGRPGRHILFVDDLSFGADDPSYKHLKAMLEGSLAAPAEGLLVYATSNRRHLMPEYQAENLEARMVGGELHPGEAVEEKLSLSDRFGLWLSFHPFDQAQYLAVVRHWLRRLGVEAWDEATEREALRWAQTRGSRSGRTAWQFARDWAGRTGLAAASP